MGLPAPEALLVEHPALPVPVVVGDGVEADPGRGAAPRRLSRGQRLRLAVQLTAVTSLLAEFDLWPGRRALAGAAITDGDGGVGAVLGGLPTSLSRVYRRLGGDERAADGMRTAAVTAIASVTGLPVAVFGAQRMEPGFFLEAQLDALLADLPRPLDPLTARSLWAERWEVPPPPEEGEVVYWRTPCERTARRLGAALWASLRRRGRDAWLRPLSGGDEDTGPLPPVGGTGTLVLAGRVTDEGLAAVDRWARRDGAGAAVIGLFPPGWSPAVPVRGFDAARLSLHLALTGAPAPRCREQLERRHGAFDPAGEADRTYLTAAASWLWRPPNERPATCLPAPLERCLRLLPDGMPEGFLEVQTGRSGAALRRLCPVGSVVVHGDRWRLPDPAPLMRDPWHGEVASLFAADDPRRLRHRALADGDPDELAAWCRGELDGLRGGRVRELLAPLAPGALGTEIGLLLAEACLSELDLAGARSALAALPAAEAGPLRRWQEAVDAPAGFTPRLPVPDEVQEAPRAAAEVALVALQRAVRAGEGDAGAARRVIAGCRRRLGGAAARHLELSVAALAEPALLGDRGWRRRVVGSDPLLVRRWLHLRALLLADAHRATAARRLLRRALEGEGAPGHRGLLELDLGYSYLDEGAIRPAASHLLRAFRLLEAAGFQHRTQVVLFNLAVCDLDALELERAERRMDELDRWACGGEDPFVTAERARLALAVGDEAGFRLRLAGFPVALASVDPRFREQLALLRGIESLLAGEGPKARRLLEGGGAEGRPWLDLLDAVEGREPASRATGDQWGLAMAAELSRLVTSRQVAEARRRLPGEREPTVAEGLALALVERLLGRQAWIEAPARRAAVRVLEGRGLNGWARGLAARVGAAETTLRGLARMVDGGGPDGLGDEVAVELLEVLGLTGLEVRPRIGSGLLWRCGDGDPGRAVAHGRIQVTPLGGEPSGEDGWRLLIGLLDLLLPDIPPGDDGEEEFTGLYGRSDAMRRLREDLRRAAPTPIEVLLAGETGVGKEVAARALHRLSGRHGQFVPVNIAAMPSALLEAELFGSVKGAFTGADRSRGGLVHAAAEGTLFLDEIGDLDLPLQVKLLRFLESREVRRVGSDRFHQVDVRIVAATHQDLERRVAEGSFRGDLYYRIATMPIPVPPLRRRLEDIPILRARFETEAVAAKGLVGCRWSGEAQSALTSYRWPGNVRELRHVVEVAMVRAAGGTVRSHHLNLRVGHEAAAGPWDEAVTEFRRRFLGAALRRNRGNRSATARELGISRQALLYHIRRLGLQEGEA